MLLGLKSVMVVDLVLFKFVKLLFMIMFCIFLLLSMNVYMVCMFVFVEMIDVKVLFGRGVRRDLFLLVLRGVLFWFLNL